MRKKRWIEIRVMEMDKEDRGDYMRVRGRDRRVILLGDGGRMSYG